LGAITMPLPSPVASSGQSVEDLTALLTSAGER
jgi:hypothetical protein